MTQYRTIDRYRTKVQIISKVLGYIDLYDVLEGDGIS